MARRHVVQYFCEVEKQYFDMLEIAEDLKQLVAENKISQEDYLNSSQELLKLKENYERIAYIIHLLNMPNKKSKEDDEIAASWYKVLKFSSKEAIINENNDVLSHLKSILNKSGKDIKDE